MKFKLYKLLPLVITLSFIAILPLKAETLGNYLTIKASQNNVNSDVSFSKTSGSTPDVNLLVDPSFSSSNNSIGIALTKSLRLDHFSIFDIFLGSQKLEDIYINYGIFYDHLDYNNYANNKYNVSINSRYGATLGLGYDINNRFAVYGNFGYTSLDYEIDSRSISYGGGNNGTDNNREISPIVSTGLNYRLTKDLLIGLEYSRQEIDLQASTLRTDSNINSEEKSIERYNFETTIDSFSLTLSRKF